jgi:hypothetical protein
MSSAAITTFLAFQLATEIPSLAIRSGILVRPGQDGKRGRFGTVGAFVTGPCDSGLLKGNFGF